MARVFHHMILVGIIAIVMMDIMVLIANSVLQRNI